MIAIIDYGAGNLKSVKNALDYLKVQSIITDKAKDIENAEKIIFPGVGNFGNVMKGLEERNLIDVLKKNIGKKPFLGICLGLQVLFEEGEESPGVKGLEIFKGTVKKFKSKTLKIPQIGWNLIEIKQKNPLLDGIKNESYFYFVHSYFVAPKDKSIVLTTTEYSENFVSGIAAKNIFGVQFHPERSGAVGLQLLKNFVRL